MILKMGRRMVDYDIDIPEQPVRVRLDMDSYMRIINNLIQNVIAHSHADKIKIALSKQGNHMELLLADNGVGIEKDDLKHIFVPAVLSLYFDLFDGFIQAYVFVFLTSLFIKESIE